MNVKNIDVDKTIQKAKKALRDEKNISKSTKLVFEMLIMLVSILVNRLGLNSRNSSKPPSTDDKNNNGSDDDSNKGKKKNKRGGHHASKEEKDN